MVKAAISVAILLCSSASSAQQLREWPEFKMAFAHQQQLATPEVLEAESQELKAFDRWMTLRDGQNDLKFKWQRAQRRHRRHQELVKNSFVSLDNAALARFEMVKAENRMKSFAFRVHSARASLEYEKLRVLTMGNPGSDYRAEMVAAQLDSRRAERAALAFDLNTAQYGKYLAESKIKSSMKLLEKGLISKVTMEDYESVAHDFTEEEENTQEHMRSLDEIIIGLENNLKLIELGGAVTAGR